MLTYHQSSGEFYIDDIYEGLGYSGTGKAKNQVDFEYVKGLGPIPRGKYVLGHARDSQTLGPVVFDLTPTVDTNVFGRSLFRIHGDNTTHTASHGCIILGRSVRDKIHQLGETYLTVV